MEIPYEKLNTETLESLIKELVTREGTDYGEKEYSLEEKIEQVKTQLKSGKAVITYDEDTQTCISTYTDNFFTPTLIGRENIIDDLEGGTLEINRRKDNNLLPLVLCYNDDVRSVSNLICLDLKNEKENFIQYYVPPAQFPGNNIKKGFRVYHLIGKTYSKKAIPTNELIRHPLTALHFSTLTQNILRISENSQSSLLQKVAKVFIEN